MSTVQQSTFIITREGRAEEAKTVVSDGLRIGRLPDSHVWLNHPTVSRLHAGVNEIWGRFYLVNLSASSATALNGRLVPFNEAEAIATGDEILIGPYLLTVEEIVPETETLRLRVSRQLALNTGELGARQAAVARERLEAVEAPTANPFAASGVLKVFWGKRTREKAGRPSPLHPRARPRPGKARFNWAPTRDLVRPWPYGVVIWVFLFFGGLTAVAALKYKTLFAPGKISGPHAAAALALSPPIAGQPANGSCTSCHAVAAGMEERGQMMNANCAACHRTAAFSPTVTRAHREAGMGCKDCHTEHQGEEFRPMRAALESCARCHSDDNRNLYNGRSVRTPHGGTYGYPVADGRWVWKGLDEEELALKPEIVALLEKNAVTPAREQEWRNAQFHAIHLYGVRAAEGVEGVDDAGGAGQVLSCGSCHKSGYMGTSVDRTHPRTTCARCHNTRVFHEGPRSEGSGEAAPSCTSCHVQHVRDEHWASPLRVPRAEIKR
jgi:pSer/pThr/pTyr-binding forkhead associated (FHA) protein